MTMVVQDDVDEIDPPAILMPWMSDTDGTFHAGTWSIPLCSPRARRESVQISMAVMLICPKCQGGTELRGTMDAYYLTWCPDCERLWRLELWTLINAEEPGLKRPWLISR
jgi:hypothetical protein